MHNLGHKHGMRILSCLQTRECLKSIRGTREVIILFGFKYLQRPKVTFHTLGIGRKVVHTEFNSEEGLTSYLNRRFPAV